MESNSVLRQFVDRCGFRVKEGNWQSVDPFAASILPRIPGVYAIYLDGRLSYVGQSGDLRSRISGYKFRAEFSQLHRRVVVCTPWGHFARIGIKLRASRKYGDWLMVERRLIDRLLPPFNKA